MSVMKNIIQRRRGMYGWHFTLDCGHTVFSDKDQGSGHFAKKKKCKTCLTQEKKS